MLDQIQNKHILIDGDIVLITRPWQDSNGYWRHGADSYIHRDVARQKLGRVLKKEEVVHHKDRNRSNNLWENLVVLPNQGEHLKLHAEEDCRLAGFDPAIHHRCSICKTYHEKERFAKNPALTSGLSNNCREAFNAWRKAKGHNRNKWNEKAKLLQQIRRAKAKAKSAELGRSP